MTTDPPGRAALLAGATGLVGTRVLERLAADRSRGAITVLARRPIPVPERTELRVIDFDALDTLDAVPAVEAVFCCLGTTIGRAGSQQAFRRVDHDYVLALARRARAAGAAHFLLVSAVGADAGSRVFYNRVKGETERDLQAMGWPSLTILRPSLLDGDRAEFRAGERAALAVLRPLSALVPAAWRPVPADAVASAMVGAATTPTPGLRIIESAELVRRGAA